MPILVLALKDILAGEDPVFALSALPDDEAERRREERGGLRPGAAIVRAWRRRGKARPGRPICARFRRRLSLRSAPPTANQ